MNEPLKRIRELEAKNALLCDAIERLTKDNARLADAADAAYRHRDMVDSTRFAVDGVELKRLRDENARLSAIEARLEPESELRARAVEVLFSTIAWGNAAKDAARYILGSTESEATLSQERDRG